MDSKSRLGLLLLLIVVESVFCRNVPQTSFDPDKAVVFTPFFDEEGNPSHGPPVITFQVSDGTQVDCVPVQHQPSAHLPSLKGHPVQTKETTMPHQPKSEVAPCHQLFRAEHGSCPEGTIAIARHRRRLGESSKWGFSGTMSSHSDSNVSAHLYTDTVWDLGYASTDISWDAFANLDFAGYGATMSVQQPYVEPGYVSTTGSRISFQIAYWKDPYARFPTFAGGGEISAGFAVDPSYFGDSLPRLYTSWGVNVWVSNEGTGVCLNTECPGYTHISRNVVLGAPVTGPEMSLFILLDSATNRYHLYYGTELIGFWNHADTLGWRSQHFIVELGLGVTSRTYFGGIVSPIVTNGRVTHTHIGTGKYSSEFGAAYLRNVQWKSKVDNLWYQVPTIGLNAANSWATVPPQCYDAYLGNGDRVDWGTYLLYGGRGGENPACRA